MNNPTRKNTGAELIAPRPKAINLKNQRAPRGHGSPAGSATPYPHRYDVLKSNAGKPLWIVSFAMSKKEHRRAGEIARHFSLSVKNFLEAFVSHSLPGQLPCSDEGRPTIEPGDLRFEVFCPKLAARLQRVADHDGVSMAEMINAALVGSIDSLEEIMVMHPQTGAYICTDWEIEKWMTRRRWIGQGQDPFGSMSPHVNVFERSSEVDLVGSE